MGIEIRLVPTTTGLGLSFILYITKIIFIAICLALLDHKYLNDRYMKGKGKIQAFMDENHRFLSHDALVMGHSTIVEMQAALGASGLLGALLWLLPTSLKHVSASTLGSQSCSLMPHFGRTVP